MAVSQCIESPARPAAKVQNERQTFFVVWRFFSLKKKFEPQALMLESGSFPLCTTTSEI